VDPGVAHGDPLPPERRGAEPLRIGVLASQGDFAAHAAMLRSLGADPVEVRTPEELGDLDGLVIPGGESTTIAKAIERDGLEPAIRAHAGSGRPILGTCAGMIICDREHLGLVDATARRNAFGRQVASFELELEVGGLGPDPMRAVFIRAPWIEDHDAEVEVLASVDGHPVVVRQGRIVLCAFHPELTDDSRLHALLMALATSSRDRSASDGHRATSNEP
jgi:pyridoxal 5'-phosphate synthase pdxT subunit